MMPRSTISSYTLGVRHSGGFFSYIINENQTIFFLISSTKTKQHTRFNLISKMNGDEQIKPKKQKKTLNNEMDC
jgi:hypothetical protein